LKPQPDVTSLLPASSKASLAGDATAVVLDLAGLGFIDSTGIGVLLAGCQQAESRGRSFTLQHPGRMVLKVLHLTGVDRLLRIEAPEGVLRLSGTGSG